MKVTTRLVRLNYAHLTKPTTDMNGNERYTAMLTIPKADAKGVKIVKDAIAAAMADESIKAKIGKGSVRNPLRDGDDPGIDDKSRKNCYFLNVSANVDYPPKLFNRDYTECVDKNDIYSGCYGDAVLNLFGYNNNGNKGIGVGILAFRKLKDGQRFDGFSVDESDFAGNNDLLEEEDIPF